MRNYCVTRLLRDWQGLRCTYSNVTSVIAVCVVDGSPLGHRSSWLPVDNAGSITLEVSEVFKYSQLWYITAWPSVLGCTYGRYGSLEGLWPLSFGDADATVDIRRQSGALLSSSKDGSRT